MLWDTPENGLKRIRDCFDKLVASEYGSVYSTKFIILRDAKILEKYLEGIIMKTKLNYVKYLKSKHKTEMKRIYLKAFPESERFPFWILKHCSKENNIKFMEVLNGNELVGIEYLLTYENNAYLMYFAIDENKQNKGYGSEIVKDLANEYNTVILSIEKLDNINREIKQKRKKFYLRNGFQETNVFYEDAGVEYEILTTNKNFSITKESIEKFYEQMTSSKILKYIIGRIFNVYDIKLKN